MLITKDIFEAVGFVGYERFFIVCLKQYLL